MGTKQIDLNVKFRDLLSTAIAKEFDGLEVEHSWSLFADRLVTTRLDGEPFTTEQYAFIAAYSDGYADAMQVALAK